MDVPTQEPLLRIGLCEHRQVVQVTASAAFLVNQSTFPAGDYEIVANPEGIVLNALSSREKICAKSLTLAPLPGQSEPFRIDNMLIGRSFHWERSQQQTFQGELVIEQEEGDTLRVINVIPLEQYLQSVISSETVSYTHLTLPTIYSV